MGVGHPSTCHQQEGRNGRRRVLCAEISDYRVWAKTARKIKRYIKKNQ
jgi:hypothetical protein